MEGRTLRVETHVSKSMAPRPDVHTKLLAIFAFLVFKRNHSFSKSPAKVH